MQSQIQNKINIKQMNKDLKRKIKAFLLSMVLIIVVSIVVMGIVALAISLGQYLPYILIGLLFIGVSVILSFPMHDMLEQREWRKQYKNNK
jgi:membrane protein YdbS with pleckstrin-like domain